MKRFFIILAFGLIAVFLLLTIQCTKFYQIEFITENNFILDASAHEFDVIARDGYHVIHIVINGESDSYINFPTYLGLHKDSIMYFDNVDVVYTYQNNQEYSIEIIGEWFTLKKNEWHSPVTRISVDENKGDTERTLTVYISNGDRAHNDINISQQKK